MICKGDYNIYKACLKSPLEKLKKSTDGMLKKELQSKIVQN